MPKGGARTNSGPRPDPNSRTSERKGYTLTALPAAGFSGDVPALTDYMPDATDRHETIWSELWSTPQACAWSLERWRWPIVADLVRCIVRAEDPESPASWQTPIRQLREDLGLSWSGLRANGWAIKQDELAPKREEKSEQQAPKRERRLRSADAQ